MRAAFFGINIIYKSKNIFIVSIAILYCHFYNIVFLNAFNVNRFFVNFILIFVNVSYKLDNAAFVMEGFAFAAALIT